MIFSFKILAGFHLTSTPPGLIHTSISLSSGNGSLHDPLFDTSQPSTAALPRALSFPDIPVATLVPATTERVVTEEALSDGVQHQFTHSSRLPPVVYSRSPTYLGRGASASVFPAQRNGKLVAVKQMDSNTKRTDWTDTNRHLAKAEFELARSIPKHPNIIRYKLLYQVPKSGSFYLVMPRGIALNAAQTANYIQASQVDIICQLAGQLLSGLSHLHTYRVIHCDIKRLNLILFGEWVGIGAPGSPLTLCIADFGLARRLKDADFELHDIPIGTPTHLAPECVGATHDQKAPRKCRLSSKSDIFAAGVTLFEVLTGGVPFSRRLAYHQMGYFQSGGLFHTEYAALRHIIQHGLEIDIAALWELMYPFSFSLFFSPPSSTATFAEKLIKRLASPDAAPPSLQALLSLFPDEDLPIFPDKDLPISRTDLFEKLSHPYTPKERALWDLTLQLLEWNYQLRPSAEAALQHPVFQL